jgi:hypothetical protein
MKIKEVTTPRDAREFLMLPVALYKNETHWIRPLDKDIEAVFDKEQNKTFRHGECIRWLLLDDSNKVIGRVAAFVNQKTVSKGNDQPTGGMGFFECIEDQSAAFMLFDQAKQWLQTKGMEAMDGPINFGLRDRWWGLLIEGFNRDTNYQCNYNFPYYKDFFEAYGFQVYFYQLTFWRTVHGAVSERLERKGRLTAHDPDYSFRHIRKDEIEKLPEYIHTVYNRAWSNRNENPELNMQQAKLLVKQMKPIMDVKLLYFGFYKGEPVSFFLSVPELNQVFKHVNGKLNFLGKAKILWHFFRKTNRKALGVLFGVVPEHQAMGLDMAMVLASRDVLQTGNYKRYDEFEINWIGDFNPKMINVVEQIDATVCKRHATYRKLFDETKPFKRSPILR